MYMCVVWLVRKRPENRWFFVQANQRIADSVVSAGVLDWRNRLSCVLVGVAAMHECAANVHFRCVHHCQAFTDFLNTRQCYAESSLSFSMDALAPFWPEDFRLSLVFQQRKA